jgi:hypothetical protein
VAGVSKGAGGDGPGAVPVHLLFVDQQPHQFGDGDDGMGVIELDGDFLGELIPIPVPDAEPADDVPEGAGDEEVLLFESQFAALGRRVVRVEHLAEVLGTNLALDGPLIVALVKTAKVKFLSRPGAPEPEDIHRFGAITGDEHGAGFAAHLVGGDPADAQLAGGIMIPLRVSVEADFGHVIGLREFPRETVSGPGVGLFHLPAILESLLEDAELVTDAVADGRDVESGERIEETGRQAAQAAIAETRARRPVRSDRSIFRP